MRVTMLGAGAVGGWLAAGLARAGTSVAILARGATLAALRAEGLTLLEGERREVHLIPATDDPAAIAGADFLLLALKGHDLPRVLPLVQALSGPRTVVVPVQNGIPWWFFQGFGGPAEGAVLQGVDPGGELGAALPVGRVLGGVAHVGAQVAAPAVIRLAKQDRILLGDPSGQHAGALAALVGEMALGGLPAVAVADIRTEIWGKLWGNATMNPLSALCRSDMLAMLDDPGVAGLIETMMREMVAIGAGIGLPMPQSIAERLATARNIGAFRTSMLQDLEAGRALELGPIIGGLVELAGLVGVPVPALAGVHGLVRLLAAELRLGG